MPETTPSLTRLDVRLPEADHTPETVVNQAMLLDELPAFLFEYLAYGWEELEENGTPLFRLHLEDPAKAEELQQALTARFPALAGRVERSEVPNRDWALAWREFFTAVPAGEDFIVIAPWMKEMREAAPRQGRIVIEIEPKTAFGTGHHATTAMCLAAISELSRAGRIKPGQRFLDLGTGSAILAIGCAKLGLTGVGLDIDPMAVDNARENTQLNHVADAVALDTGSIEHPLAEGSFDLVLANILAEPLIRLAPQLTVRLAKGGVLVLSGLLVIQAEAVTNAYRETGLPVPRQIHEGEWAALVWD